MKLHRLILCTILSISVITISNAQEKKAIKGFSGGMMVHSGYQFGGDNPYNLDISSPTFGIGGCAKLHLTKHFRTGFEGYFSTAHMPYIQESQKPHEYLHRLQSENIEIDHSFAQ